jgi:hypothetical protein
MRVVYLENAIIAGLAANPEAAVAFGGCLEGIAARSGCQTCGSNKITTDAFARSKRCFAGLASAQRETLKQILGASEIRIVGVTDGGRIREVAY